MTAATPPRRATGEFVYTAASSSPLREEWRATARRRSTAADPWSEVFAAVAAAREGRAS